MKTLLMAKYLNHFGHHFQCYNIPRITLSEFGNQICERAKKFDRNILEQSIRKISNDTGESCKVYCATKSGDPITKSWTYPDGTMCRNHDSSTVDNYFCVNGRCEVRTTNSDNHEHEPNVFQNFQLQRFSCNDSASNYFKEDSIFCVQNSAHEKTSMEISTNNVVKDENSQGLRPSAASLVHHVLIPRNGWFKSINHRM